LPPDSEILYYHLALVLLWAICAALTKSDANKHTYRKFLLFGEHFWLLAIYMLLVMDITEIQIAFRTFEINLLAIAA